MTMGIGDINLLIAIISGIPAPPSLRLLGALRICSNDRCDPSTTCTITSALDTSSSVDLKASISDAANAVQNQPCQSGINTPIACL